MFEVKYRIASSYLYTAYVADKSALLAGTRVSDYLAQHGQRDARIASIVMLDGWVMVGAPEEKQPGA